MSKPSIPKGTRDFLPDEVLKRQFIFDTCKQVFELHGFLPIETPSIEKIETLTGKYGEEGDQLLFKIAHRGEKLKKVLENALNKDSNALDVVNASLNDLALRYDLTVPFARFVVQHQNDLNFPFKRYQIQNVWRADKPQKGRYREFYQCDVDIIGSKSLLNELDLVLIIKEVFEHLKVEGVVIKLNNRKILEGIAEVIGKADSFQKITIAIDKIDKIGVEACLKILGEKGFSEKELDQLRVFLELKGTNDEVLDQLEVLLKDSELGMLGVSELKTLNQNLSVKEATEIDLKLARGLNYYTGCIFEVVASDYPSSICGGGRYDDLTDVFGLKNMSGVGVSFGADRIYDLMLDRGLFESSVLKKLQVLFLNMGDAEAQKCIEYAALMREKGISCDIYPENSKFGKQMKFANNIGAKYVAIIGDEELKSGKISLKNMKKGSQELVTVEEMVELIV